MVIEIGRSTSADTRSCDPGAVSKEELLRASLQHIADVARGLAFFQQRLTEKAAEHDYDKLTEIDWFHRCFQTKFEDTSWWDNHRKIHRHHLTHEDGIPSDINLLDVLEYISDCIMAGRARNNEQFYQPELPSELLQVAFQNTVKLLDSQVQVVPSL